jgi:hypothetical protein
MVHAMSDWSAHVTFCDDIRQEMNGKFILIGVYTGEMLLFASPTNLSMATFIELYGLPLGGAQIRLAVRFEDGHETVSLGETYMALDMHRPGLPVVMAPTGLPFYSDRNGKLIVSLAVNAGEARDIGELAIVHRDQNEPERPEKP